MQDARLDKEIVFAPARKCPLYEEGNCGIRPCDRRGRHGLRQIVT